MPKIRMWPVVAFILLAAAVMLGVVAAHTDLLTTPDQQISINLHDLDSGWVHTVVSTVSLALSPAIGVAIIIVWTCALVLRDRRLAALSTFVTLCAGWGAAQVLKHLIDRPRPPYEVADGPSYPSGHTALAVAVVFAAVFLARKTDRRDAALTLGTLLVALVMFSRVILGAHYLTDTVGAVLASSGAIVLAAGIWQTAAPWLVRRSGLVAHVDLAHVDEAAR